jgi:hypothetical protein
VGVGLWVGGGVLEPWASSDFLGKSPENPRKISSPSQNPGHHRQRILGFLHHQTATFMGAPITTREEAGSLSCDSAACEG